MLSWGKAQRGKVVLLPASARAAMEDLSCRGPGVCLAYSSSTALSAPDCCICSGYGPASGLPRHKHSWLAQPHPTLATSRMRPPSCVRSATLSHAMCCCRTAPHHIPHPHCRVHLPPCRRLRRARRPTRCRPPPRCLAGCWAPSTPWRRRQHCWRRATCRPCRGGCGRSGSASPRQSWRLSCWVGAARRAGKCSREEGVMGVGPGVQGEAGCGGHAANIVGS